MSSDSDPSGTLGSESLLSKNPNESWKHKVYKELCNLTIVSDRHPHIFSYFLSHRALLAERKRHRLEAKTVIHPLSMFSLTWRSFMIVINLIDIGFSSLACFVVTNPFKKQITLGILYVMLDCTHVICILDMIVRFNMGYTTRKTGEIVLDRRKILRHYITGLWVPDLMSCIPAAVILELKPNDAGYWYLIADLLPLARVTRIFTLLRDLKTFFKLLTNLHIWYRMISHLIVFALIVHCFTCLLYVPSVMAYYLHGKIPEGLAGFLATKAGPRVLTDLSLTERYLKGMFVALCSFFSTGFTMHQTTDYSEIMIRSLLMLFGTMFKIYAIVFALKTYMTIYNLSMRYQELMDQVEKYIHQQQFPASLMRRLRDFYWYRFQERYYKEKQTLSCLSEQLQNEILLYTYKSLINKTPVLQNLPPAYLGEILGCLEYEVYMPNDLIYHAGDEGKDMYFINTGTVTFYSLKGVELYHLEDGDVFGSLSLFWPDIRRLCTTVAIEITQLYRMSSENFKKHISPNPLLLERIKRMTTARLDYVYAQHDGLDLNLGVMVKKDDDPTTQQPDDDDDDDGGSPLVNPFTTGLM